MQEHSRRHTWGCGRNLARCILQSCWKHELGLGFVEAPSGGPKPGGRAINKVRDDRQSTKPRGGVQRAALGTKPYLTSSLVIWKEQ